MKKNTGRSRRFLGEPDGILDEPTGPTEEAAMDQRGPPCPWLVEDEEAPPDRAPYHHPGGWKGSGNQVLPGPTALPMQDGLEPAPELQYIADDIQNPMGPCDMC